MLTFLLQKQATARRAPRYYRIEVGYNLFGEYSVLCERGGSGRRGRQSVTWFPNLREACIAADQWQSHARTLGYQPRH